MTRPCAIAITFAAVVGCSAPPPKLRPTASDLAPLSTAQLSVRGVTDGQDATLVAGAQGGFHVWLSYAVDGASGSFTLERTAHRVADDAVVLRYDGEVDVGAPDASGWWSAPAPVPMFMCPTPIGISIVDQLIDFSLRLLDDAGLERARTHVTLTPRCPAAQLDTCMHICTG